MNPQEKRRYTIGTASIGFFFLVFSVALYFEYTTVLDFRTHGRKATAIVEHRYVEGDMNQYVLKIDHGDTTVKWSLASKQYFVKEQRIIVYYLQDEENSYTLEDQSHLDSSFYFLGFGVFIFGFVFIYSLLFPETAVQYLGANDIW
jgi:hypothetical protein